MHISLGHFLFSVLLSTGAAFKCGQCQDEGTTCTPMSMQCNASEQNCITMLDKGNLVPTLFTSVEMKCATKEICQTPFIQLTFGAGHYITKETTCCETDGCTPPPLKIPPLNTTTNGRSCPTCYSTGDCVTDEILNCTGSDTVCFSFSTTDKTTKKGQIKGCTMESVCTALKTYGGPVVGKLFVKDVTCQNAKGSCSALEFHLLGLLLMTLILLSLH